MTSCCLYTKVMNNISQNFNFVRFLDPVKHLWKKRNIIVTFQSGQLTEQPKTLDDLGHFDLKMFRNCPIRIEIITGSHIFILFLPRVVTLCLHETG
jgi:hypothetical protein